MQWTIRGRAVLVIAAGLQTAAVFAAEDMFAVNVEREKQLIEGHLREAAELLESNKFQQTRATLRLVDDRLAVLKSSLPKGERHDIENRRDALTARMRAKEDSLVNVAKTKLYSEGLDAALDYSQQVLRRMGLPEERLQETETFLLDEGAKVKQKKEREDINRAVAALEKGRNIPSGIDPYLAFTARQMVRIRRDSLRAVRKRESEKRRGGEAAGTPSVSVPKTNIHSSSHVSSPPVGTVEKEIEQGLEKTSEQGGPAGTEVSDGGVSGRYPATRDKLGTDDNELARRREEDERARQAAAVEREKRIEEMRREQERIAALEKLNRGQTTFHETEQASMASASVREYMRQRKEEEKRAQNVAVQIYELIERKRPTEAMTLFRSKREYLSQYLSKEVFIVLERSVADAVASSGIADTGGKDSSQGSLPRELPKEEQYVMRIRAYLAEKKWEPAVSLFSRTEKELKKYMPRDEFEKLRALIASARQYVNTK